MPLASCVNSIQCPCSDDPVRNFSSETEDVNLYIGFYDYSLGNGWDNDSGINFDPAFAQLGCKAICFSAISQEDADLCAQREAQACAQDTWQPPDGVGAIRTYGNHANSCRIRCSDYRVCQPTECVGEQTFTWTVAPNTVYALTQGLADLVAYQLACQQARANIICIGTSTLPPCCIDTAYHQQLSAHGGVPFVFPFLGVNEPPGCTDDENAGDRFFSDSIPYDWTVVSGSLPPGLELRACTGIIKGTATTAGTYTFTVQAVDSIGAYQTQALTICVMGITNSSPLADATIGTAYSVLLVETPGDVGAEVWTIIAGSLPPGLTLASNGAITGTATGAVSSYSFTVRVTTNVC